MTGPFANAIGLIRWRTEKRGGKVPDDLPIGGTETEKQASRRERGLARGRLTLLRAADLADQIMRGVQLLDRYASRCGSTTEPSFSARRNRPIPFRRRRLCMQ